MFKHIPLFLSLALISSVPAAIAQLPTMGNQTPPRSQRVVVPPPLGPRVAGDNSIPVELETSGFTTLAAALKATGLNTMLAKGGPYTIFAPSNQAFARTPGGSSLLLPANRQRLTNILKYHVVPGKLDSFGLQSGQSVSLKTLSGKFITVQVTGASEVRVNGANVTMADIPVRNGVIHGIDGVLLPQ